MVVIKTFLLAKAVIEKLRIKKNETIGRCQQSHLTVSETTLTQILTSYIFNLTLQLCYTTPCANIASATVMKPAILAPFT